MGCILSFKDKGQFYWRMRLGQNQMILGVLPCPYLLVVYQLDPEFPPPWPSAVCGQAGHGMILTLSASSPTNSDRVSGSHSIFNVISIQQGKKPFRDIYKYTEMCGCTIQRHTLWMDQEAEREQPSWSLPICKVATS